MEREKKIRKIIARNPSMALFNSFDEWAAVYFRRETKREMFKQAFELLKSETENDGSK